MKKTNKSQHSFLSEKDDPALARIKRMYAKGRTILPTPEEEAEEWGDEPNEKQQQLQTLIAGGATFTLKGGYHQILADATITENAIWFFEAFGEDQTAEHVIDFHHSKINGQNIDLFIDDGRILATIAPLETPEEAEAWQKWSALIASDPSYQAFIASLKNQICD
jgi:hypothetical protein